jgi:hypothetical protein
VDINPDIQQYINQHSLGNGEEASNSNNSYEGSSTHLPTRGPRENILMTAMKKSCVSTSINRAHPVVSKGHYEIDIDDISDSVQSVDINNGKYTHKTNDTEFDQDNSDSDEFRKHFASKRIGAKPVKGKKDEKNVPARSRNAIGKRFIAEIGPDGTSDTSSTSVDSIKIMMKNRRQKAVEDRQKFHEYMQFMDQWT